MSTLPWFLGWRYSRIRHHRGFLAFISASSFFGIGLGVMALILGLSAMNGFQRELEQRILSIIPQGEYLAATGVWRNWPDEAAQLKAAAGITGVSPVITVQALVEQGSALKGVLLRGILPEAERQVSGAEAYMTQGGFDTLQPQQRGIILGQRIAAKLGLSLGDEVTVVLPTPGKGNRIQAPRKVAFRLVGMLQVQGQLDGVLGFIHLSDAQALYGLGDGITGLTVKVNDVFAVDEVLMRHQWALTTPTYVRSWMMSQGYLYQDIQLVRTIMMVVMLLVMAVACFNIVSTLVMSIQDRRSDIAILKTMGATVWQIRWSFVIQGMINGLLGTCLGGALGCGLALYLSEIVRYIEGMIGYRFLNPEIYFVDFLPTELVASDVMIVCGTALAMCFGATLYPAWQASGLQPARELNR